MGKISATNREGGATDWENAQKGREKLAFRGWKMRAKRANCDKFGKRFGAKVLKLLSFSKISLSVC